MSNLLIYQSSAGTGKTYKLAKEYLKFAFKYPGAFKNILAITFTNKATEEMKSRVLKFLSDLKYGNDTILKKQLEEEGINGSIEEKADATLKAILHNYSDFSICTIDSFFNRVLRSFAKELSLQLGYKIELDTDRVLKKVTEKLFKDIGKDEDLRQYIEEFVLSKISEDKGWDIEKDIEKLGEEVFKERYWEKKLKSLEQAEDTEISDSRIKIKQLLNDVNLIIGEFEETLKKISIEAKKNVESYGLDVKDFSNGSSGVIGFLLFKIGNKKEFDLESSKRAVNVYNDNTGWYTAKSAKKDVIQKAVDNGLYTLLKNAIEYIRNEFCKYNTAKELKKTLYTIGIFDDLIIKLDDYRKNENSILQSDVNNILRGLVSTDNSPFIYEKIGSNYNNLLIDEFQDTSTFQWKNLLPLIINAVSERNNAIVVGDVKQSIYRWRSGNMKLLLSQIYEDLSGFKELLKTEYLKINRRSRREIVNFNNIFFNKAVEEVSNDIENIDNKNILLSAYSNESLIQEIEKDGGYVSICFLSNESEEISSDERFEKKITNIISEVLNDDYALSDILVLVRKNSEAREISGVLTKAGYNIVSSESLLVHNSPKVRIIIDLVKFICDNKDTIAKADALYNYMEFISEEKYEFREIFENTNKIFYGKMPKRFFKDNVSERIKPILNDLSIYEVCENLIQILGFNCKPDTYLIKLQNVILEYSKENSTDLMSFLNWWEENKFKFFIDSPPNTNAINIMTIHKAKGLQGKVVLVPYADWKMSIDGSKDLIWASSYEKPFNKSAAYLLKATVNLKNTFFKEDYDYEYTQTKLDNLNLLYVAFTRAEERLYVLVNEKRIKDNAGDLIKKIVSENFNVVNDEFIAGKKEKKQKKDYTDGFESGKMKHYISNEWYKKTIIKPKHKNLKEFTDTESAFKMNTGIIIHKVLSYMKTEKDCENAVNKVYIDGLITEVQKDRIKLQIENLFENPIIRNWFNEDWEIKNEKDIILQDGSLLRPDRVLIKDKNAIIIDYKTGSVFKENEIQINKYGEVLKQIGFTSIKKYLLYLNFESDRDVKITEVI